MRYYKNGNALVATVKKTDLEEITKDEYDLLMTEVKQRQERQSIIAERSRPFAENEVTRMIIAQQINSLPVDDNTALRMTEFYPEWIADHVYSADYKVKHSGVLWRCRQEHTSQTGWEPENAASLWEQINETHAGTLDDPIPYSENMALESGKYYMQNYVIYLCNRDTGNPVYNPLADLVNVYVEMV